MGGEPGLEFLEGFEAVRDLVLFDFVHFGVAVSFCKEVKRKRV